MLPRNNGPLGRTKAQKCALLTQIMVVTMDDGPSPQVSSICQRDVSWQRGARASRSGGLWEPQGPMCLEFHCNTDHQNLVSYSGVSTHFLNLWAQISTPGAMNVTKAKTERYR